jgi:hypothetical protein
MLDLAIFPERASKQVGDVRLPVVTLLDRGHVDSVLVLAHAPRCIHVGKIAQPHQWGHFVATKRKTIPPKYRSITGLQANSAADTQKSSV